MVGYRDALHLKIVKVLLESKGGGGGEGGGTEGM